MDCAFDFIAVCGRWCSLCCRGATVVVLFLYRYFCFLGGGGLCIRSRCSLWQYWRQHAIYYWCYYYYYCYVHISAAVVFAGAIITTTSLLQLFGFVVLSLFVPFLDGLGLTIPSPFCPTPFNEWLLFGSCGISK